MLRETANLKVNGQVISFNVSDRISQADRKSSGKTILKQSQETQDSHFLRCVSDFTDSHWSPLSDAVH